MDNNSSSATPFPAHILEGSLILPSPWYVSNPFIVEELSSPDISSAHPLELFGRSGDFSPLVAPGQAGSDVLFVFQSPIENSADLMALRLGEMTSTAIAQAFPEYAEYAVKPKVIFRGGDLYQNVYVVILGLRERGASPDTPLLMRFFLFTDAQTPPPLDFGDYEVAAVRIFQGFDSVEEKVIAFFVQGGVLTEEYFTEDDFFTAHPTEAWRAVMKRSDFPNNLFSTWASYPERN